MNVETIGALLPLFVAVPLVIAGFLITTGHRLRLHATVNIVTVLTMLLGASGLVYHFWANDGGAIGHQVGNWPAGIAIPFAADMFTALMLSVTLLLTIVSIWFAQASRAANSQYFAPLVLILAAGVNGALLTADLFNLFVFLEVMLLPSYGLYVLSANRDTPVRRIHGARLYVTMNLLTSTLYMVGVGFLYGTAGTVNIGVLTEQAQDDATVAIAGAVCIFALAIKASVVPVHGWLARAYPGTSPAITALFSGLHTKVAIYAIYRIYAVVYGGDTRFLWVGVVFFSLTMLIGVFGAVGEKTTRTILSFHMVSQIGYILLGVALFTELGLTAGIFYLLHHMIVKASLFLSTGAVEVRYGTGVIGSLGGIARTEPVIAVAFMIAALSLAGIPPFSGFVAKFMLIVGAVEAGEMAAVIIMLFVSLITLLSMLKIWTGMFWEKGSGGPATKSGTIITSETRDPYAHEISYTPELATEATHAQITTLTGVQTVLEADHSTVPSRRINFALAAPAVTLAIITVIFGLGAQFLLTLSGIAAEGLMDTTNYVEAVLGT
ncbi:monovalent cation/H+ antiporter subunit D family protein [Enteractinococcus helveticum]|uniref:Cation:proton antiporter n=1 Tax=Enteractinococcus helveticum TaxID=1837282 RepID=A0A1B7LXC6_9MICC|nr:monovalent cation/H+ antiporter subunit D family protein [Enteractinococcus helveticum]OAV59825.1 cation:proton antiporter [Enteractinococcus helveticum]